VDINDTICTCCQTTLNKLIIHAKIVGVQSAAQNIVDKVLPANWEAEYVEPIIVNKMVHLTYTICISLGEQRGGDFGACVISQCVTAAEIEPSYFKIESEDDHRLVIVYRSGVPTNINASYQDMLAKFEISGG
jgi:hypothetical protein